MGETTNPYGVGVIPPAGVKVPETLRDDRGDTNTTQHKTKTDTSPDGKVVRGTQTAVTDRETTNTDSTDQNNIMNDEVQIEHLKADIEQTRNRMADTIDELQKRLDPQKIIDEAKETIQVATVNKVKEVVSKVEDATVGKAKEVVSDVEHAVGDVGDKVSNTVSETQNKVQENPTPFIIGGVLMLIFLFLWSRRKKAQEIPLEDLADYLYLLAQKDGKLPKKLKIVTK